MNKGVLFLGGLGLGAGLMYFLDPTYGKRRRVVARDQLLGAANDISECLEVTWTDVAQRAQGFAAETSALCSADHASDEVIEARVRAKMGHCVSHPSAIHVSVENGRVTLEGAVRDDEAADLVSAVRAVRGVTHVENHLHQEFGDGQLPANPRRRRAVAANWSPATRLCAALAGGTLVAVGLTQRFPIACLLGTAGLGLLARGIMNANVTRVIHGRGRWANQLQYQ